MPLDPRKKQKKLERRKAKDKVRRKTEAARQAHQLTHRFDHAGRGEILDCLVPVELWEHGIGNVLMSRDLGNGRVGFALFLLDVYCLGVKDVAFDVISRERYDVEWLPNLKDRFAFERTSPDYVRKLVEDAVEYARSIGLEPHADYRQAKAIFGDVDASLCRESFEFGRDGKPFFVNGPHDSPMRCRKIVETLRQQCGPERFDYLLHLSERELPAMNLPQLPGMRLIEQPEEAGVSPDDDPTDSES
ncbi:MAG TPA: hypothetical protein VMV10_31535 [Pirellulales bacterium]|nr:hypothetical protein [Pirellulales bacterium]